MDLQRMLAYKANIQEVGKWFSVDPSYIVAIISWRVMLEEFSGVAGEIQEIDLGWCRYDSKAVKAGSAGCWDFGCKTLKEIMGLFLFYSMKIIPTQTLLWDLSNQNVLFWVPSLLGPILPNSGFLPWAPPPSVLLLACCSLRIPLSHFLPPSDWNDDSRRSDSSQR